MAKQLAKAKCAAVPLLALLLSAGRAYPSDLLETIALVRHGEKPDNGLGQLTCQGLNRALALPPVVTRVFKKPPDFIFAPNPAASKNDGGEPYYYLRPLATIEPTAITFGLPVDVSYSVSDIDGLRNALKGPQYQNAFILIAWEHKRIVDLARELLADHGVSADVVPKWRRDDYDGIFIVTISRTAGATTATFARERERLDGQPNTCPHAG